MNFFYFLRCLFNLINYISLPKKKRTITFYSENKNYWPDFKYLIKKLLESTSLQVCFISSDKFDPGLSLKHKNFHSFHIDESHLRNWLFENIETKVMVMTMPDIGNYQVKRSKNKVHYVYIQHSLVSLHMIYRKNAFDNFDTIFCAGPHHIKEIKKIEKLNKVSFTNIVEHGYGRLDSILKEYKYNQCSNKNNEFIHVLIAPSWGENCIIETGIAFRLIQKLILLGCKVTLRPHPQTIKYSESKINFILKRFVTNKLFEYEKSIEGHISLKNSDLMISDWSGAAIDYSFAFKKPVLFIDVPRKINNDDYLKLNIEPIEIKIRSQIGQIIIDENSLNIDFLKKFMNSSNNNDFINNYVFNIGKSEEIGSKELEKLCYEL